MIWLDMTWYNRIQYSMYDSMQFVSVWKYFWCLVRKWKLKELKVTPVAKITVTPAIWHRSVVATRMVQCDPLSHGWALPIVVKDLILSISQRLSRADASPDLHEVLSKLPCGCQVEEDESKWCHEAPFLLTIDQTWSIDVSATWG